MRRSAAPIVSFSEVAIIELQHANARANLRRRPRARRLFLGGSIKVANIGGLILIASLVFVGDEGCSRLVSCTRRLSPSIFTAEKKIGAVAQPPAARAPPPQPVGPLD